MSRGGRGGGRGGGFGSRDGPLANMGAMGITFADIQAQSKDPTALYPTFEPLPVLSNVTDAEKEVIRLQQGFATRMRRSQYHVTEKKKTSELSRYSDKYVVPPTALPKLRREDLHQPFFPSEIFEDYFNSKKKAKANAKKTMKKINIDELMQEGADEDDIEDEDKSKAGSDAEVSDYDVEEEYDNDYAENYFDNGEGDDDDDIAAGGGDGGDYD